MLDSGASVPGFPGAGPPAWSGDGNGGRQVAWRLAATPSALPGFRRELTGLFADTRLHEDDCYDLLLAACEAASNAVEHAVSPRWPFVDVLARADDAAVTVVVRDSGGWRAETAAQHRGRGLAMMRLLADMSLSVSDGGTTVTLRKRTSPDGA